MASFLSSGLHSLQTILGKTLMTADSEREIEKRPTPPKEYEEWKFKAVASKKNKPRSYYVRSLWHENCSFCDSYLSKSTRHIEDDINRMCLESYETAFYALKEGFDGLSEEGQLSSKFPFLLFGNNMNVLRQLREHWLQMYPTIPISMVTDDLKFLEFIDPLFQHASRSLEYDPAIVSNYDKTIKSIAHLAETIGKSKTAEMIRVLSDDRVYSTDVNQQFTVMCWGEPVYAFLGGPLSLKQIKYMKVAHRIAHIPERDSDRLRLFILHKISIAIYEYYMLSDYPGLP